MIIKVNESLENERMLCLIHAYITDVHRQENVCYSKESSDKNSKNINKM